VREFEPLLRPLALLTVLLFVGTVGYILLEGYTPFEAVYITVTTLATVGYGEIRPLSTVGRLFTIGLILLGVGGVLFVLTELARFVYGAILTPLRVISWATGPLLNRCLPATAVLPAGTLGKAPRSRHMKTC
jgi:hypothetical protein